LARGLLFEGPYISIPGCNYAFEAQEERFLVLENPDQFKSRTDLTVVTNFVEILRRRVPRVRTESGLRVKVPVRGRQRIVAQDR
jgi:hypothetical protein